MHERFSDRQRIQENQYEFPYHYQDLADEHRGIQYIDYLSCVEMVKGLVKPSSNQWVLDAGCGDGRFCYELEKERVKLVGVDFSEKAISFARAFCPGVEFHVQDLRDLSLGRKFDYIVLIEVLEHIPLDDLAIVLERLSGHLTHQGKLMVTVPTLREPLPAKHYQHFDEKHLRETLHPFLVVDKIIGHHKAGFRNKIFQILTRLGLILFPLRRRLGFFYSYLRRYFERKLETCKPTEGLRLVAVCSLPLKNQCQEN